jgi:hypothetical protein
LSVIAFLLAGTSLMLSGCYASAESNENEIIDKPAATQKVASNVEAKASQTSTPVVTPEPKPTAEPTPTPYFDLNNLSDEELLLKCGMSNEDVGRTIGYAVDLGGVFVVEYTVNDLKCMALVSCSDEGNRCIISDWLTSSSIRNTLFSVDKKTFDDVSLAVSNGENFNNPPFSAEPISEKYEGTKISVEKVFSVSELREYMESTGKFVPNTEYSEDIEGLKMIGNVVSIVDILRYFLTVAPQEETTNHIKFNFPQYEAEQTPHVK